MRRNLRATHFAAGIVAVAALALAPVPGTRAAAETARLITAPADLPGVVNPATFDAVSLEDGPQSARLSALLPSAASPPTPVQQQVAAHRSAPSWLVALLVGLILATVCFVSVFLVRRRRSQPRDLERVPPSPAVPDRAAVSRPGALATVASGSPPPALLGAEEPAPPDRDEQIDMLRARIEIECEPPFVVLVTSALPGDGKDLCARLLAESMATAGYRTILVDIDSLEPSVVGAPQATSGDAVTLESHLVDDEHGVTESSLSHASFTRSASKKRVKQVLADLRERFEAVIVSAASPVGSSIGLLFAMQTETIVVTIRAGRSIKPVDRELAALIERSELPVLGVVTISQRKIRDKAKRVATPPPRPSQAAIAARANDPMRLAARKLELPGLERD